MKKVTTLEGIAKIIGATGFKQYAKDYGNSRVNLDGDVVDAINTLDSYQSSDTLINHFNCFKREMTDKYASSSVPFYKTDAFNEQNQQEINEFGYIVSM